MDNDAQNNAPIITKKPRANPQLNMLYCVVVFIFGAVIVWASAKLPPADFEPLGSAALPQLLAAALMILSVIIFRTSYSEYRKKIEDTENSKNNIGQVEVAGHDQKYFDLAIAVFLATALFVAVMDFGILPYNVAAFLYLLIIGFLMGHQRLKSLLPILLFSGLLAVSTWLVFVKIFFIDLP